MGEMFYYWEKDLKLSYIDFEWKQDWPSLQSFKKLQWNDSTWRGASPGDGRDASLGVRSLVVAGLCSSLAESH